MSTRSWRQSGYNMTRPERPKPIPEGPKSEARRAQMGIGFLERENVPLCTSFGSALSSQWSPGPLTLGELAIHTTLSMTYKATPDVDVADITFISVKFS